MYMHVNTYEKHTKKLFLTFGHFKVTQNSYMVCEVTHRPIGQFLLDRKRPPNMR